MLTAALLMLSSLAIDAPCQLITESPIRLESERLKIADIVNRACPALAYAPDLGNISLLTLRAEQSEIILSMAEIHRLIRLRVPGLKLRPPPAEQIFIYSDSNINVSEKAATTVCYKSRIAIARRGLVSRTNLDETPCLSTEARSSVIYDFSQNVTRSSQSVDAGTYFGHLSLSDIPMLDTKTDVSYSIEIGAISIERTGVLVQPATNGSHAFVSDRDGNVLSIRMVIPLLVGGR